MARDIWSRL